MKTNQKQHTPFRTFGGKLDNFISIQERRFEQKHLKAYLRGDKYFSYGTKINENGIKIPMWFQTKINNNEEQAN